MTARERPLGPSPCLDVMREVEERAKLGGFEVAYVKKITAEETVHRYES